MKKTKLIAIQDNNRTLYYRQLKKVRKDGVSAKLVGYTKDNIDYWY